MRVDRFFEIMGIVELIDDERDEIDRRCRLAGKDKGVRVRGMGICLIPPQTLTPPKL